MTMETAPDATREMNKRVRFAEEPSTAPTASSTKSAKLSPKTAALNSLHSFTASLHSNLKPIFDNLGEEWLDIISRHRSKMLQATKMIDDDDFIPRSARNSSKFEFYVPKSVEDLPEFTEIKDETETIVLTYRKALKQQILKVMKVEIEQLEKRAQLLFIKGCYMITKATLISESSSLATIHHTVATIMEFNHAPILENVGISYEEFNAAYKLEHVIATYPPVLTPLDNQTNEDFDAARIKQSFPSKTNILATLIHPLDVLLAREKAIEIDLSLKKLNAEEAQGKANEDTQDRIDAEMSIDNELISERIRKETNESTKSLRSELGQLKKLVRDLTNQGNNSEPKKATRGRQPTRGASLKKKSKQQKGRKTNADPSPPPRRDRSKSRSRSPAASRRKKPPAQKAAGRDSDSSTKRRKKKPSRQRTKK